MPNRIPTLTTLRPRTLVLVGVGVVTTAALTVGGLLLALPRSHRPHGESSQVVLPPPLAADPASIAFLGDSITFNLDVGAAFGGVDAVNLGVSGNTTSDVLARMQREILSLQPAKAFVMIGTNDIGRGRTTEEVLEGVTEILDRIAAESPHTVVYLESLYPVHELPNAAFAQHTPGRRTNEAIQDVNAKLAALAAERGITFIDVYSQLVNRSGQLPVPFTYDGLHLTPEGYTAVVSALSPYVLDTTVAAGERTDAGSDRATDRS